jgi:transcription termination factor Rho
MSPEDLKGLHLAQLHERAAELGVPNFRKLRREDLVEAIAGAADDGGSDSGEAAKPKPKPRRRRARGGGERKPRERVAREEKPDEDDDEDIPEDAVPVSGVLDVTGQGHGFLRLEGLERDAEDVYVSASQVRRCELRVGDEVAGPARGPRRGERHRALVHVDKVNGEEPEADRTSFDDLKATMPTRRLALASDDMLVRSADALAPLAFGQSVLVDAAPRSGRTTFLRALAGSLASAEGVELVILLVDERPEEAEAWREALPNAELAIATADMRPANQLRAAELALERSRRLAERGADAVLLVDSLSRVAVAAEGDLGAVKRIFGSGRELDGEDSGSLTVVATTLDPEDDAHRAVISTENAIVVLSAELAASGVTPAIDAFRTRASNEDRILSADELESLRGLRAELEGLEPAAAAAKLAERFG